MKLMNHRSCLSLILFVLTIGAYSAAAQTVFTGPGFTIQDNAGRVPTSCSTVNVAGITSNVFLSAVTLTNINHTSIGDLQLQIYKPGAAIPPAAGITVTSPPDVTPCNFAGTYTFRNQAGAQTLDAATSTCTDNQVVTPGTYLPSEYGGGTNPGPVVNLAASVGTLTPAQANGNWLVCVFDFAGLDTGTVAGTSITLNTAPTAAGVEVAGRVVTGARVGLKGATVTITDQMGNSRSAITGRLGSFSFQDVELGQAYTITVMSQRYTFAPQILSLTDSVTDLTFQAQGGGKIER